jgi:hypothetical protein
VLFTAFLAPFFVTFYLSFFITFALFHHSSHALFITLYIFLIPLFISLLPPSPPPPF